MLQNKIDQGQMLLFDGAMVTMLQQKGLTGGELPERYNIEKQAIIKEIHSTYLKSGAEIITTNTFGANRLKMKEIGYSVGDVIKGAIDCAKAAIKANDGKGYIALNIGPIGQLMAPMGTLTFDEAYSIIKEQVMAGEKAGCDAILFETFSDIYELKAGILAAKENTKLPILATMTFESNGRTLTGTNPETLVAILEGLGVNALGMNCSLGPAESKPILEKILKEASVPVMIQPNAGLPVIKNGETVYNVTEDEFITEVSSFIDSGLQVIGGCCGTTPSYIEKISNLVKGKPVVIRQVQRKTKVASAVTTVLIGDGFKIIGERINPTGKKRLKEALLNNNMDYIVKEAITQEEAGAAILDVNVGLPELKEDEKIVEVIRLLQEITNLPLQIDSSEVAAIEMGCRYYNGKPLINSVNGKKESMDAILPIAKKYGGAFVALTLDESGIPASAEARFEIAKKIMKEAEKYGIPKEDIIVDCLVSTASAQQKEVMETIKAVRKVHEELGLKTVLGVSNVSFGLPNRPLVNKTFLTMAMTAGLDVAIFNPMAVDMIEAIDALKVLSAEDEDGVSFINRYGGLTKTENPVEKIEEASLETIILQGIKGSSAQKTRELLKEQTPLEIVNTILIPALDIVGQRFEKGALFLPQLIQSAETVKNAFVVIKEAIIASGEGVSEDKGKVILATVKGDIHDIGKNIVKVLMENYGYHVIDLGKDVNPALIVETALKENVDLIGLSALMTTTVKNMEEMIKLIKDAGIDAPVVVGGAVLTEGYAQMIGADFYGKDARESVSIADSVCK